MSSTTGDGRRRVDGLRRWLGAMLLGGLMAAAVGPVHAATVSNLNDAGAGSLRDAVASTPAGGTVDFAPGLTGTITLTGGQITIDKALTITGPGASSLSVVDAGGRVFEINAAGAAVGISGLRLTGGGLPVRANGGAILNTSGLLTLDAVRISRARCRATGWGAASAAPSPVSGCRGHLGDRSWQHDRRQQRDQGRRHPCRSQAVVIENSTISGNTATDSGSAISFDSSWGGTTIRRSPPSMATRPTSAAACAPAAGRRSRSSTASLPATAIPAGPTTSTGAGGSMSATGSLFSGTEHHAGHQRHRRQQPVRRQPDAGRARGQRGGTTPTLLPQAADPAIPMPPTAWASVPTSAVWPDRRARAATSAQSRCWPLWHPALMSRRCLHLIPWRCCC